MRSYRIKLKNNPYYIKTLFCKLCGTNRGVTKSFLYCRRCMKELAPACLLRQ